MKTTLLFAVLSLLLAATAFPQGSLTPPGPPAPTMKTLDELAAKLDQALTKLDQANAKAEKRTPISSLPFTISESGSYYLVGNLQFTAASGAAITVAANDVTLDLMGFTLSSTGAVTGNAITIGSGPRNVAVKNGAISGNTTVTISGTAPDRTWTVVAAGFSTGIAGGNSTCQFTDVRIFGCRNYGIFAAGALIERVSASGHGLSGINSSTVNAYGTVLNCIATGNGASGIINGKLISGCIASDNALVGISTQLATVTKCAAISNGRTGIQSSASITNSSASSNGDHGISGGGVIAFCSARLNNQNNNGSLDITGTGVTRTGNNPTP